MKRLVLALLLTGCITHPKPEPSQPPPTYIVVTAPCRPTLPAKPPFTDSDAQLIAAPNSVAWAKEIINSRPLHLQWEATLEAALAGCASVPSAAPSGGTAGAAASPATTVAPAPSARP